jgi:hypothetical protein
MGILRRMHGYWALRMSLGTSDTPSRISCSNCPQRHRGSILNKEGSTDGGNACLRVVVGIERRVGGASEHAKSGGDISEGLLVLGASGDAPQGLQVSVHDGVGDWALLHAPSGRIIGKGKGETRTVVDAPACRVVRVVVWTGWACLDTCACVIIGEAARVGVCGREAEVNTLSAVRLPVEVGVGGTDGHTAHCGVVGIGVVAGGGSDVDDGALAHTLPSGVVSVSIICHGTDLHAQPRHFVSEVSNRTA